MAQPVSLKNKNDEYKTLLIAIDPNVKNDSALLDRIQRLFSEASFILDWATHHNLRFKQVTVALPNGWSSQLQRSGSAIEHVAYTPYPHAQIRIMSSRDAKGIRHTRTPLKELTTCKRLGKWNFCGNTIHPHLDNDKRLRATKSTLDVVSETEQLERLPPFSSGSLTPPSFRFIQEDATLGRRLALVFGISDAPQVHKTGNASLTTQLFHLK
ncbi:hypothetical protein MTO96_029354 [Rhipicephalus appendiculatus]